MAGASVGLIPPCLGKRAFLKKNFFCVSGEPSSFWLGRFNFSGEEGIFGLAQTRTKNAT